MTAERVGTFEPGSPEWHAARAAGLGASEIAAVVGLSPWESRYSLWHRKRGTVPPVEQTDTMSLGHYFEPGIARRFADEHPELRVRRTGTWRSRERPWQIANPDRLAYPGRIPVEIKYSPHGDEWGPSGSDEIPIYYRCQVMQQLDVLDAEFGYVAAVVGGSYREYVIRYDATDAELLRKEGAAFMASLADGTPPDLDTSTHTYQAVRALHPDIDDREVEIDDQLAADYRAAVDQARDAAEHERQVKARLLDVLGTGKHAVTADGERIAYRKPHRTGVALVPCRPKPNPTTIKGAVISEQ